MTMSTDWLPPLVLLKEHGGNWDRYLATVYGFFWTDFVSSRPSFSGQAVTLARPGLWKGKELTFWHLISEGSSEGERLPGIRRCERIRWPRPMVEGVEAGCVRWWRSRRKKERRVGIAVDDFSYVVFLIDRRTYTLLLTAYSVERDHRRRKLAREWREAEQKG